MTSLRLLCAPMFRRSQRRCGWLAWILPALLLSLTGCGVGAPSFSGGGVPIGGSRLYGRVVAAASPLSPVSHVTVTVTATPAGGTPQQAQTLKMTTGQDGAFDFAPVLPGASNGTVQVTATPDDANFRAQQVSFPSASGHTQQLIVTLPPANVDPEIGKTLSLSLPSPGVPSGDTIRFQAVVRDAQGRPLNLTPTLLFDGNFGTISGDSTFFVPQGVLSGAGTITAFWDNLTPQSAQVRVDNNAPQQPPPAPILPENFDGKAVSGKPFLSAPKRPGLP